jgi:hypothetical protein
MKVAVGVLAILVSTVSWGKTLPVKEDLSTVSVVQSSRMHKRVGAYLGVLGDPFPTLVGVNLAYNVFDFLRATAGLGQVSASVGNASASATTVGAGARFLVPGWSLSPVAGLSVAYVGYSSSGGGVSVGGFNSGGLHAYASLGVDWQTVSGFNLGAGVNVSTKAGVGVLPYLNLGWFSDFI